MAKLSSEEMQKRIDSLPEEVQDLLYSPEMYTAIKQISSKHQLHIDQMDLLEAETAQAMLGITKPEQFPDAIAQSLNLSPKDASGIAKDIDEKLFSKVRSSMMKSDAKAEIPKVPNVPPAIANTPVAPTAAAPAGEKSVVMPSSVKAAAPIADIKPPTAPVAPTPTTSASGPVSKPISAQPPVTPKPAAVPPIVATVAPTTPTAPKVDELLLKPSVSVAPLTSPEATKGAAKPSSQVVIPAPTSPEASQGTAQTTLAPTPPPPPIEHKIDPYREPLD